MLFFFAPNTSIIVGMDHKDYTIIQVITLKQIIYGGEHR